MFAAMFSIAPTWIVIVGLALFGGMVLIVGIVVAMTMMSGQPRE